jgi:hypothetical protein
LGLIALAVAVVPSLRTRPWPLAMPLCFALAGVCAILVGPLRMDCSTIMSATCRSHEAAGGRSWHYEAHIWLSPRHQGRAAGVGLRLRPLGMAKPADDRLGFHGSRERSLLYAIPHARMLIGEIGAMVPTLSMMPASGHPPAT